MLAAAFPLLKAFLENLVRRSRNGRAPICVAGPTGSAGTILGGISTYMLAPGQQHSDKKCSK
jgi:hypothetical protein